MGDAVGWKLDVKLVSGRCHPDASVVAVGVLTGGELPPGPTPVVVRLRNSVVVEEGAFQLRKEVGWARPGLHGLELPRIDRAAVQQGALIEPIGHRVIGVRPPREVFGGARRVAMSPDYGGVLFRTPLGMADVDALSHRIDGSLQQDLWRWYLEWDESTTTDRWSWAELQDEAGRLIDALNAVLADECTVVLEPVVHGRGRRLVLRYTPPWSTPCHESAPTR